MGQMYATPGAPSIQQQAPPPVFASPVYAPIPQPPYTHPSDTTYYTAVQPPPYEAVTAGYQGQPSIYGYQEQFEGGFVPANFAPPTYQSPQYRPTPLLGMYDCVPRRAVQTAQPVAIQQQPPSTGGPTDGQMSTPFFVATAQPPHQLVYAPPMAVYYQPPTRQPYNPRNENYPPAQRFQQNRKAIFSDELGS